MVVVKPQLRGLRDRDLRELEARWAENWERVTARLVRWAHEVGIQQLHTAGPNCKNPPKIKFEKLVKLIDSYLHLQQFDMFWMWKAGTRKRKLCKFAENRMEKLVKALWVNLFSAGFSYLKPLCCTAWNACRSAEKGCCGGAAMWCPGHFRLGAATVCAAPPPPSVRRRRRLESLMYFHGQGFEGEAWTPPALHSGKEIKQLRKCRSFLLVCLFNKLELRIFAYLDEVTLMGSVKVQIFWEGHKCLSHLPLMIWRY